MVAVIDESGGVFVGSTLKFRGRGSLVAGSVCPGRPGRRRRKGGRRQTILVDLLAIEHQRCSLVLLNVQQRDKARLAYVADAVLYNVSTIGIAQPQLRSLPGTAQYGSSAAVLVLRVHSHRPLL